MTAVRRRDGLLMALMLLIIPFHALAEEDAPSYRADSLEKFKSIMLGASEYFEPEFYITCPEDVFACLTENDFALIHDIEDVSGIAQRDMEYWSNSYRFHYSNITYYPGYRVLNKWRRNDFSDMSETDWALYNAAQEIVTRAQAETNDTLSLEKYLHDEIARRTVYYTNGNSGVERKDTAIGVLLDGAADCDGYADAFYLLGNLAGFTVRLVHGTTDNATSENPYHMWNEIHLNGEWYAVDVTWDDYENPDYAIALYYIYFNVGGDLLSRTHTWDNDSLLDPIADTSAVPYYYNAMGGVCGSWDEAANYMLWRFNQGVITDSITLPNTAYDNAALNAAVQRVLPGWGWKSWYKTVGGDLFICYYLYK